MLKDEDLYTRAMKEFNSGQVNADLQTKSLVLVNGDKGMAKFQYIRLRVEQLKRESIKRLPGDIALGAIRGIQAFDQSRTEAREKKAAAKEEVRRIKNFGKKKSEIAGAQRPQKKAILRYFTL